MLGGLAGLGISLAVAALGGSAGGCDQGTQKNQIAGGPLVRVSGANVGPGSLFPADAAVRIQFDRMLLPSTVNRQGVALVDANNAQLLPVVTYDPVARIVTLSPQANDAWLKPDQPYKVILHVAKTDEDPYGFRAIDRSGLFPGDPHLVIGFLTGRASGAGAAEPKADYCRDVAPILQQRCSASLCHGARTAGGDTSRFGSGLSSPAAGLILETAEGMRHAIGRVANGANTGGRAAASEPSRVFGVDMPIVEPGYPERSWLMYKMLLATPSDPATTPAATFTRCDGRTATARGDACTASADCTVGMRATGAFCSKGTGTCVDGCETSADCAVGTCDAAAHACSAPPPNLGLACVPGKDDCGASAGWKRQCDPQTKLCAVPLAPAPIAGLLPAPLATPPDDVERGILAGFVPGQQMPYPNIGPNGPTNGNPALTFDELERVRLWIAQGAAVTGECVCAQ